jgi:hypothetical protein
MDAARKSNQRMLCGRSKGWSLCGRRDAALPRCYFDATRHEIGFDDLRNKYASPKTLGVVTFAGDEAVRSWIGQGRQEHRRRPFSM